VNAFAGLSGDCQWIHVDPARARASPLGGAVVHGNLLLTLVPRLRGYTLDVPVRLALNYGFNRVRFPAPVRVGAAIRLRSRLVSVEDVAPDQLQVVFEHVAETRGGAKPGMVAQAIIRYML